MESRRALDRIICEEINVKNIKYLIAEAKPKNVYLNYDYEQDKYEWEVGGKRKPITKETLNKLLCT